MTPIKNNLQAALADLAKRAGLEVRVVSEEFDEYVDLLGHEITMRARWKIERDPGILITLFAPNIEGRRPEEINLSWFIQQKGGDASDLDRAASDNVREVMVVVERFALPYLLGISKDFAELERLADRIVQEKLRPPGMHPRKRLRQEWIP